MRIDNCKNFITEDEKNEIVGWVNENLDCFHQGQESKGKRLTTRCTITNIEYSDIFFKIQKRIMEVYKIPKYEIEDIGKDGFITVKTQPGGDTFKHVDGVSDNTQPVRFNIVVQAPDAGGKLFVNDKEVSTKERELHCYFASKWKHYVTTVEGIKDRIIVIFGFNVGNTWEDECV